MTEMDKKAIIDQFRVKFKPNYITQHDEVKIFNRALAAAR